jgi:hypothetical protein
MKEKSVFKNASHFIATDLPAGRLVHSWDYKISKGYARPCSFSTNKPINPKLLNPKPLN